MERNSVNRRHYPIIRTIGRAGHAEGEANMIIHGNTVNTNFMEISEPRKITWKCKTIYKGILPNISQCYAPTHDADEDSLATCGNNRKWVQET